MTYDNATSTLTIGNRQGEYPGMEKNRQFNVVKVDAEHPIGNAIKAKGKIVDYNGSELKVQL